MKKLILALALLPLVAHTIEAGPLKLGRSYKDETNGFRINPPRKWEMVPTKFQEVSIVGKWATNRAKKGFPEELYVLRFLKGNIENAANPMEALKRGIPGYGSVLRLQPKDLWAYIKKSYRFYGITEKSVVEDVPEFRLKSKKFKAHFRIYRAKLRAGQDPKDARTAARRVVIVAAQIDTVEESDSTFGVIYEVSDLMLKDMLGGIKSSIKGFRIIDPDDEDEEGASDADIFVDSSKKPEAWRNARKSKLIPGWKAIDTENYLIVYNKEVKPRLIKQVAKHIEAIRKQVYEKLFPPQTEIKAISVVRVCKDRAEYHRYGGPGGSAGYWSRGDEELVFYQDKSNKKDSLRVLYHEAFHQYIHYAVGNVAPHSWFNEGHGDYFAGHNYRNGKFRSDVFRWRTGIIANALARKTYVKPLGKFLKYTQREYYANPGLCYAQGWSFVYFLREIERRKIKKYSKYYGLLDRYFDAIKRNVKKVKEGGLEGLNPTPKKEDPTRKEGVPGLDEAEATVKADPTLPRPPGLEKPFPGEHPLAGAGEPADGRKSAKDGGQRTGETKTVAGPQFRGIRGGLDAAVDEAFKGIDMEQLEKDWIEFSK